MMKMNLKRNLPTSILISLLTFALYLFWFIFSDRRVTFLYGHLHTNPYDSLTIGRYFVTALVVGGIIFILNTLIILIVKKINTKFKFPNWQEVWKLSCLILILPLFILLTFFGQPSLSALISLWVITTLILSLGLALYMSDYVLANFKQAIFTFLDGFSLIPILILTPVGIDFAIRRSLPHMLFILPLVTIVMGLLWSLIMNFVQKKLKQPFSKPTNIFLSSMTTLYLVGSFIHYLISRPEHLYISTSSNFFSKNLLVQILTFALAFGLLWLIGYWHQNNNWTSMRKIIITITLFSILSYGTVYLASDKNQNIWICEEDNWVKQGEPEYDQPFPEECGIIDKAFGLN